MILLINGAGSTEMFTRLSTFEKLSVCFWWEFNVMIDQDWLKVVTDCCHRADWEKLKTELLEATKYCHEFAGKLAVGNDALRSGDMIESKVIDHSERVALAEKLVSLDDFGNVVGLKNRTTTTPLSFDIVYDFLDAHFQLYYQWNCGNALLKKHKDVIATVSFTYSIIPPEVPTRISEVKLRMNGQVWKIHATDKDDFPSVPHAHNYDEDLVLDLRNGDLYRVRDFQKRIRQDHLEKLRAGFEQLNVEMPPLNFDVSADREKRRNEKKLSKQAAKQAKKQRR
jgi:hypothetical protein